jgi:hypothetical protein
LKIALDTSDQLHINDPKLIVNEAAKKTENETPKEPESEIERLRRSSKW